MDERNTPFQPYRGAPTRGYDPSRRHSNYARQNGPRWEQDYNRGDYEEMYNQRPSHWNQSYRQQPYRNSSWRRPPHGNDFSESWLMMSVVQDTIIDYLENSIASKLFSFVFELLLVSFALTRNKFPEF